ncbi:MAG: hypothetical protein AAFQ62_16930, partial [Pseudomonadota bacterium]
VYDIRQRNSELSIVSPQVGVPRPIVSLAYVPPTTDQNAVLKYGLNLLFISIFHFTIFFE